MVVDAVMMLDELLPLKMIGIKKISGGALEVNLCECDANFCVQRNSFPRLWTGTLTREANVSWPMRATQEFLGKLLFQVVYL